MAVTIDWGTKVIMVLKEDLTLVQSTPTVIYNMDLNWFRLQLKDLEDSEAGMCFPNTHNHNTEVVLSGLTYARVIEIINGYTVTFEDDQYAVNLVGANSNVADMVNVNQVSVRSSNSAGMVVVSTGSGLSIDEHNQLMNLPDASNIENVVLDAKTSDHDITGSVGKALIDASLAGNPWSADLTSNNDVGTFGEFIQTLLTAESKGELSTIPDVDATLAEQIQFLYQYFRNKRTVSNTQEKMYMEDGSLIGTSTLGDDGTTFTRNKIE